MHPLLILPKLSAAHLALIGQSYEVINAPDAAQRAAAVATEGARIKVVLTIGTLGLTAAEIAAMPQLELVCVLGAGYENVDVDAVRARGIPITNGSGANDSCVADHAFGLLLAVVRAIPKLDQATRQGIWRTNLRPQPGITGKRLGILGLGTIGKRIARRAEGFDLDVGYHNRQARTDVPYAYFDSLEALAAWSDFLIIATPGGAATRHLVNAGVLQALGPEGFIVNIARGSVVDTQALAAALRDGTIAGAGLDVYESEPHPPAELIGFDSVVLSPHIAGTSPDAVNATVTQFLDNAGRHFSGRPLLTPI